MTNLSQVYKGKEEKGTNITTRKTYLLSVDELYVEPGYNVRDIDQTHVEEFRDAFIAGEHVPPLAVQVTEQGIKVIDGHHRYFGAKLAQEAGHELRLECKDFVGSEADRIAFMVTSSQGRALLPLERAAAYQRLVNQGWEPAEIAKKVKRSVTDVEQHLQLLTVGDGLIDMVRSGEVAATTALALQREHGAKASSIAQQQMEKAKAAGKKKLTKTAAMPKFNAEKARRLVELLCDAQARDDEDGQAALYHNSSYTDEIMSILAEYREGIPGAEKAAEPELVEEQQGGEQLPLKRVDILEQSGVETMACVVAAFGMKHEYTFSESKYAHVWASDSVASPEMLVVPPETVQKAKRLIQEHQDDLELKLWIAEKFEGPDEDSFRFRRFHSVLVETRFVKPCTVGEFIELVEKTDPNCWENVRLLRGAVKELLGEEGTAA
ncbi:ParB/RepB/Spo0J family partition protein [Pantoea ananatis]|uniref:ParB/RepB/Spo0J family partition protein n=1 Tax=Pantoea ananas TaxID=553 RepID=UPI000E271751|nr:chromosome partitioning protein ParB [Pantoea ananatis]REE77913.1 ParB family chromosome partitioning protein [Pantoea ananatis]BBL31231.1 hypothetical protein PAFU01_26790 [Pantoea ananatis]